VLGGCYQQNMWESQPDLDMATRIMQRCVDLCPSLTAAGNGGLPGKKGIEALSIVRHGVGLRPVRDGGPRVEAETVDGLKVIHCYGHGGAGYQSSWGSCNEVVKLVESSM
jgi:D-amino-acid oxidase